MPARRSKRNIAKRSSEEAVLPGSNPGLVGAPLSTATDLVGTPPATSAGVVGTPPATSAGVVGTPPAAAFDFVLVGEVNETPGEGDVNETLGDGEMEEMPGGGEEAPTRERALTAREAAKALRREPFGYKLRVQTVWTRFKKSDTSNNATRKKRKSPAPSDLVSGEVTNDVDADGGEPAKKKIITGRVAQSDAVGEAELVDAAADADGKEVKPLVADAADGEEVEHADADVLTEEHRRDGCRRTRRRPRRATCHDCNETFESTARLLFHQQTVHEKDDAAHIDTSRYSRNSHRRAKARASPSAVREVLADDPPVRCEKCEETYKGAKAFEKHLKVLEGDRRLPCVGGYPHCEATFATQCEQRRDRNAHRKLKLLKRTCPYCGKVFSGQGRCIQHMRIHTYERPFPCSFCSKAFKHRSSLVSHERIHTNFKPHPCEHCGKPFTSRASLASHLKSYPVCDYAGKSKAAALDEHSIVHSRRRHWPCDRCGQVFDRDCVQQHRMSTGWRSRCTGPRWAPGYAKHRPGESSLAEADERPADDRTGESSLAEVDETPTDDRRGESSLAEVDERPVDDRRGESSLAEVGVRPADDCLGESSPAEVDERPTDDRTGESSLAEVDERPADDRRGESSLAEVDEGPADDRPGESSLAEFDERPADDRRGGSSPAEVDERPADDRRGESSLAEVDEGPADDMPGESCLAEVDRGGAVNAVVTTELECPEKTSNSKLGGNSKPASERSFVVNVVEENTSCGDASGRQVPKKRFSCDKCSKTFAINRNLKRHLRRGRGCLGTLLEARLRVMPGIVHGKVEGIASGSSSKPYGLLKDISESSSSAESGLETQFDESNFVRCSKCEKLFVDERFLKFHQEHVGFRSQCIKNWDWQSP